MKLQVAIATTVTLATIFLVGCNQNSGDQLVNSPEYNMLLADNNTSAIWSVDILEVIDKSGVQQLDLGMAGLVVDGLVQKISDTALGGVDFSNNSYFAIKHDEQFNFDYSFTVYPVIDRSKVYATLKSTVGFIASGKHGSEGQYDTYLSASGTVAAWDDRHLVILFSDRENKQNELITLATTVLDNRYIDAEENESVRKYLGSEDDFNCFIDLEKSIKMSKEMGQLSVNENLISAYHGGHAIGRANFTDGEINFTMELNADKLVESQFNVFADQSVSKEMIEFVTADESINVGVAYLKVDHLIDLMKNIEFENGNLLNSIIESGISIGDFEEMLSGEVGISVVNLKAASVPEEIDFFQEDSYYGLIESINIDPELIIGLGISDGKGLAELLEGVPGLSNKEGVVEISGWYLIEQSGKIMLTENFELAKKVALGEQLFDGELDVTEEEVKGPLYGNFNTNYGSYSNDVLMLLNDRLTESGIGKLWMAEKITLSGDPNRMSLRIVMKEKAKNSLGTFVDSMFEAIFSY